MMMIKKISKAVLLSACIVPFTVSAQGKSKNILKSIDIKEIQQFIELAHPDDPRRIVLKKKLVDLKNAEWVKGAKNAKPMEARKIESFDTGNNFNEREEFDKLLENDSSEHKGKTVQLLNSMFNNDINSKEVALLIKNDSDCNIIMKFQGRVHYKLPVKAHSENTIVLDKDEYVIDSNVCGVAYHSNKNITKSIEIDLKK